MLFSIILLYLINISSGYILQCNLTNNINDCIELPYCIWCLENNYTTNYTCMDYNYCSYKNPGLNCTKNYKYIRELSYCNLYNLLYFILILGIQYMVSTIIILLFIKILYPNRIMTQSERQIMYILGGVIIFIGLMVWFLFYNHILNYVLVIFSIIGTLGIVFGLMNYKNYNSLPSYEQLTSDIE